MRQEGCFTWEIWLDGFPKVKVPKFSLRFHQSCLPNACTAEIAKWNSLSDSFRAACRPWYLLRLLVLQFQVLMLLPRVNDVAGSLIHPRELILVLLVYFKSVRITICNMTSQRDSANPTGAFSPHKIAGWGSCPLVFTEPLKVTESHSATANTTTQMFSKIESVNYYARLCNVISDCVSSSSVSGRALPCFYTLSICLWTGPPHRQVLQGRGSLM